MKEAINVDELLAIQYFDFNRRSTRQGRAQVDTISCKIRGLRSSINKVQSRSPEATSAARQDDGTRAITIEGCDYRVPKEILINFLSCYGEVVSDVLEVVFNDNLTGGGNRMGSYSVTVKLHPNYHSLHQSWTRKCHSTIEGSKNCATSVLGHTQKKTCQSSKKLWMEYLDQFISLNPDVPDDCYGRWLDIINKAQDPTINMRREAAHSTGAISNEINNQSDGAGDSAAIAQDLGHSVQTAEEEQATVISVDPIVHSGETSAGGAAAEWLIKGTNRRSKQSGAVAKGPSESEFKIPMSEAEYVDMISILMCGGSSESEAELIIAARRTPFNKALKLFRKTESKTPKWGQRKPGKNCKTVSPNQPLINDN
jgi:hypothetical protein